MAEHELGVSFPAAYRAYLKAAKPAKRVFRPCRREWGWDWGADRQPLAELLPLPFPHPDSYVNANADWMHANPAWRTSPTSRTTRMPGRPGTGNARSSKSRRPPEP